MAYCRENSATGRRTPQNHVSKLRCRPRSDDLSEFLLIIFPLVYTVYFLGNVINVRGCFCIMQLLISFTNWLQQVVHLRFTSPCSVMVFALCYIFVLNFAAVYEIYLPDKAVIVHELI